MSFLNFTLVRLSLIICLTFCFISCQTYHPLNKYNYYNGSTFYNDSLRIKNNYFGDIKFKDLSKVNKREIENITRGSKHIDSKDLLVYAFAENTPEYNILLFYKELNDMDVNRKDSIELVLKDPGGKRVLYKRNSGNKTAYFLLEAVNDNNSIKSILNDGFTLTRSFSFNMDVKENLNYGKVFEKYKDNPNYLLSREKLEEAPISKNDHNEWMQFQYLATINSFVSNSPEYNRQKKEFEESRREYLSPIMDTLLRSRDIIRNSSVIEKIHALSNKTRVIMLNENHWYPQHRQLAIKLLKPLKDQGYTHLALEALYEDEDSKLNKNKSYPTFSSGYYTREPSFGRFIRRAKELGFTIVGYENYNTKINRELGQAQNLKDIVNKDPSAKLFVYAGLDHIIEEETKSGKRMAAYFKEITNIDPITLNQTEMVFGTKDELVMIPYEFMKTNEKFQKPVDFFIINNLEQSYENFYNTQETKKVAVNLGDLNSYNGKDILISVYNKEEYLKYKLRSVPVITEIHKVSSDPVNLVLPMGSFFIRIVTRENNLLYLENRTVK